MAQKSSSKISRSKIYVSTANRRTFAGSGRYRRARYRTVESFSTQWTDEPV